MPCGFAVLFPRHQRLCSRAVPLRACSQATNGAGLQAFFSTSEPLVIDVTPPVVVTAPRDGPAVDLDWWMLADHCFVNWAIGDAESPPTEFEVGLAMGSTRPPLSGSIGDADLAGLTWKQPLTPHTTPEQSVKFEFGSGDLLQVGVWYYAVVKGTNQAGLVTVANSDGFQLDLVPVHCRDVDVASGAYHASTTPLILTYECNSTAGVLGYQVSLEDVTTGEVVMPQTDAGLKTHVVASAAPVQGHSYRFTLVATNVLNLVSTYHTQPTVVDITRVVVNTATAGIVLSFSDTATSPKATVTWDPARWSDPESGILPTMGVTIGVSGGDESVVLRVDVDCSVPASAPCGAQTFDLSAVAALPPVQSSYYVASVWVSNGAGLEDFFASQPTVFDATPPVYVCSMVYGVALLFVSPRLLMMWSWLCLQAQRRSSTRVHPTCAAQRPCCGLEVPS